MDVRWQQAVAAIQDATVEPAGWDTAISEIVSLCGGRAGHLMTVGAPDWLQTNVFTGVPDGTIDRLLACGVADPCINPRVRQVLLGDTLTCQNDLQMLGPDERDHHSFYRELDELDIGYGTWTMLLREGPMNVAMAMTSEVSRAERRPHDEATFMVFADLVRRSVRVQLTMECAAEQAFCDALDQLAMPAFLLGADGFIHRTNAAGDLFMSKGAPFGFRRGRMVCLDDVDARRFDDAVTGALSGSVPGATTVALGDVERGVTLLDLTMVRPSPYALARRRSVLVVIRTARADRTGASARALAAPFALTEAETSIMAMMAQAKSPEQIAMSRRVSLGTVRTQIRSIYAKVGVQKAGDLIRIVEGLGDENVPSQLDAERSPSSQELPVPSRLTAQTSGT